MINKMIKELKETNYYDLLVFKEKNVLFSFVGGSQLTKITDERSDFDIVCVVNTKPTNHEYGEYLIWNDKKIHFYYTYKDSIFEIDNHLLSTFCTNFYYLKKHNTIFYKKDEVFLNFCLKNSDMFFKIGCYWLNNSMKKNINEIIKTKKIKEQNKTKLLHRLICYKKELFNEPIDNCYINKIKRIRWQEVEQKYIDACIQDLIEFKKYIEENPLNVKEELQKLKTQWEEIEKSQEN